MSGELVADDRLLLGFPSSDNQQVARLLGEWTYRPVTATLMSAAKALFGSNVQLWHGLSILLHAINATLLYTLLQRLIPGLPAGAALLATLVFLLHPAGSEGVLWISALAEPTGALFVLIFFHAYLRWRGQWTLPRLFGLCLLALAACFAKETAIALPILVLAFELLHGTRSPPILARLTAILVLASVLFLVARTLALGALDGNVPINTSVSRVLELASAHFVFIWLPHPGPFALRPPEIALFSSVSLTVALALFLVLCTLSWRTKMTRPPLLFAILWGCLLMWPAYVLANVQEGFFAARQAYMATLAVPMILAGAWLAIPSPGRNGLAIALAASLLWMGYATGNHANTWRSNLDVFRQSLAVSPDSDELKLAVADEEAARLGRVDAALEVYRAVIARTGSESLRAEYLFDMARITHQANRLAESNHYLYQALRLRPDFANAWTGLGSNAWLAGRHEEAEQHFLRALAIDPTHYEAKLNLENLLARGAGR